MSGNSSIPIRIWEPATYQIPYIAYSYKYEFPLERRYWNAHLVYRFIVNYWHYSIYIAIGYVFLIFALQSYMRPRKPFKLNASLTAWNTFLAVFSLFGAIRSGEEFFNVAVTWGSLHHAVCFTYDPSGIASLWNFLFIMSKVFELVDTIFIVLRKKPLIFLHWYHHATVIVMSWHGAKTIIAPSRIFIVMNFTVHAFMYTYYAVTSTGRRPNRIYAMFITTIQNLQMFVGVLVAAYVSKVKWIDGEFCHMTSENLALSFFVYATFAVLFARFFMKAYFRKMDRKPAPTVEDTPVKNGDLHKTNGSIHEKTNGHLPHEKKTNGDLQHKKTN